MSSTTESVIESVQNQTGTSSVRHTSELRIDAPHFVGLAPEFALGPTPAPAPKKQPTPELSSADPPAIPLAGARERIQRQANELGNRLESRCRNLDRREAQLNTRCAEFDREIRSARFWISEKQTELREQKKQLDAEAMALSLAEDRQTKLKVDEEAQHGFDDSEFNRRCEELKVVEQHLRDTRAQLETCRRQLVEKRAEFDHQVADQRKLLAQYQAQVEAELVEKREKLDRQAQTNDQIRAVLERCREEIEQKHRESLQLRLATEELWVRMSDGTSSTAMLQSLSKIRSRLADEYRTAETRLVKARS